VHDFHDFLAFVLFLARLKKFWQESFWLVLYKIDFFSNCSSRGILGKAQLGKLAFSCASDCFCLYNRLCVSSSSALYINVRVPF